VRQPPDHAVANGSFATAAPTPAISVGDVDDLAGQYRPVGLESLSDNDETELVKACERGQVRAGEGSVRHVEVFWMRRVGTFIIRRPRPLPRQRRAAPLYTLNCEEPIFSVGAYHYFGTGTDYLTYCIEFLRPQGSLGIVVPGIRDTPDGILPPYLADNWSADMCTWLPPDWWRRHWERTGLVTVDYADFLPHGWQDWLRWLEACNLVDKGHPPSEQLLQADQGNHLGLTRVVAHRSN